MQDALRFIEEHALFTRTGPQGIRQVNVRGLVATAFTHRDSRAGDPDLHTHVAVANKVQTLDGRWLSIDGRVLFKAKVAASETYNTALEQHLRGTLGVRFAERLDSDPTKRPIREIVGVDPRLNQRWSTRRAHIKVRQGELAVTFQRDHGRPPTPVEALHLAQQATLETREAKHEPRSLAEQRATWRAEAEQVLGGRRRRQSHDPLGAVAQARGRRDGGRRLGAETADRVLAAVEEHRSTWQMWHVRAEAQRHVRTTDVRTQSTDALVDLLVDEVLHSRSVPLAPPDDGIQEPEVLRRVDGASVYTVAGADLYTSQRILDAEQRLIATAGRHDGTAVDESAVDLALLEMAANGTALDAGQAALVRSDVHLRGPVAAGHRAGRGREDHRHARPHLGLDPGRRPGHRPGPVRRRRRRPRRTDRHPRRHAGQAHLVPAARRAARLGGPDRPVDLGDHRRGRDGRHPHPRPSRPATSPRWVAVSG